jgi:single-strand DNA-binding protein
MYHINTCWQKMCTNLLQSDREHRILRSLALRCTARLASPLAGRVPAHHEKVQHQMSTSPVTLIGNLTNDPELRFIEGGKAKLSFGIAVERSWKSGDEWKKEVSFFNVIAWGEQLANEAANVLSKGVRVAVTGRLQQRNYEANGDKKSIVEVVADEIAISVRSIESFERRVREPRGDATLVGAGAPAQRRPAPADEPF